MQKQKILSMYWGKKVLNSYPWSGAIASLALLLHKNRAYPVCLIDVPCNIQFRLIRESNFQGTQGPCCSTHFVHMSKLKKKKKTEIKAKNPVCAGRQDRIRFNNTHHIGPYAIPFRGLGQRHTKWVKAQEPRIFSAVGLLCWLRRCTPQATMPEGDRDVRIGIYYCPVA